MLRSTKNVLTTQKVQVSKFIYRDKCCFIPDSITALCKFMLLYAQQTEMRKKKNVNMPLT